jgi:hypothetical protein
MLRRSEYASFPIKGAKVRNAHFENVIVRPNLAEMGESYMIADAGNAIALDERGETLLTP